MKIKKNKIVFASVLSVILLFITTYSVMLMDGGAKDGGNIKEIQVPKLEGGQKQYDSKLDAINDLQEVHQSNAPSIYNEKLIDSLGHYDPDLPIQEKEHTVDSLYAAQRFGHGERSNFKGNSPQGHVAKQKKGDPLEIGRKRKLEAKEMGLEHQLFFTSAPAQNQPLAIRDSTIYAVVDGDQVVKVHSRLRMRLNQDLILNDLRIPKNTPVYGFVDLAPNRVLIDIENIDHHPVDLKAFDLQDGSEGIYVENSFREEAANELVGDIVEDINIPSVPQVTGLTKIFQRNNRNVKVTVLNNYTLILKHEL